VAGGAPGAGAQGCQLLGGCSRGVERQAPNHHLVDLLSEDQEHYLPAPVYYAAAADCRYAAADSWNEGASAGGPPEELHEGQGRDCLAQLPPGLAVAAAAATAGAAGC